ncbi:MAG: hypothetical protein JXA66_05020 [Oligoflexia bacterium]|nr:hypothetical protein [Oligoflexia bacterium]
MKTVRYYIKNDEKSGTHIAVSAGPAELQIYIKKGLTVSDKEAANYGRNTIFIDGVFDGPPFLDNDKAMYSLDHHKDVIRAFTLSTCEQALVMLAKGFSLGNNKWNIYINEPDLDAVLAIWIFSNYERIMNNINNVARFVRVEGIIDVHGFTMFNLLGYSDETLAYEIERIEKLLEKENRLKANGLWKNTDYFEYTADLLQRLDDMFFPNLKELTPDYTDLYETTIEGNYLIKACRFRGSIYELEKILKEKYGSNLLVIIMEKEKGHYTLKIANDFISGNLLPLYDELNRHDAKTEKDKNQWGGSDIIGGSPRASGSGLTTKQVFEITKQVYNKPQS